MDGGRTLLDSDAPPWLVFGDWAISVHFEVLHFAIFLNEKLDLWLLFTCWPFLTLLSKVFWQECLIETLESVWVPFPLLGLLELCQLAYTCSIESSAWPIQDLPLCLLRLHGVGCGDFPLFLLLFVSEWVVGRKKNLKMAITPICFRIGCRAFFQTAAVLAAVAVADIVAHAYNFHMSQHFPSFPSTPPPSPPPVHPATPLTVVKCCKLHVDKQAAALEAPSTSTAVRIPAIHYSHLRSQSRAHRGCTPACRPQTRLAGALFRCCA